MTISVDMQLPIEGKKMGVMVTMSAGDAVALVGEIGSLLKGEVTSAEMLNALKDALVPNIPTL